jgi:spore coat protein CotH
MMHLHILRLPALAWALCLVWLVCPRAAAGQTTTELFDDSRLHTLELTIHSRDWEDLKAGYLSNNYYPADVSWGGARVRSAGVRSRGRGTRSGTKPGLELEFDYYSKGQRFVGLRSLVLDNLWTDASLLREMTAMALLRRVGVPAPRESFARLVVNGEFAGLYAMVEPIDREFALANLGAPGNLFEYRWNQSFYETYPGDELEPYQTLFASRNGSPGSMESLYGPIRDLFLAINATPDGEFMAVDRYLDLASLVRLAAADAFMAEYDGLFGYDGMNNVYLYQVGDGRSYFIPWDKDHSFWTIDVSEAAGTDHLLMAKVLGTPELKQMYLDALQNVAAAAAADNWLDATIVRYYELVRDAALADQRKRYDNEVFEAAVADLRALAVSRITLSREYAERLRLR